MAVFVLTVLILAVSLLYASVGQAGGSGYLAAMALLGFAPAVMKPTALVLNVLVALISTVKFWRAGRVPWVTFWPFAAASIPAAFIGGMVSPSVALYQTVAGVVLWYAAYRLLRVTPGTSSAGIKPPRLWAALIFGTGIGLLSGFTGIGGGIVFGALLLSMRWAETRETLGMSAALNLSNSSAGLLGHLSNTTALPSALPLWAAAAVVGGWVGADYGSRRLSQVTLQRLLAVVLIIAGFKLIFV